MMPIVAVATEQRSLYLNNMIMTTVIYIHQDIGILEAVEHSQLAIAKISAMFPTVPESHIKELMKK